MKTCIRNNLNPFQTLAAPLFAAALLLAGAGSALADVRYVDVNSTNAMPPYISWATAATNVQDAVDAAVTGDEIVVTNGIYATGGRATVGDGRPNRVAVDKPLSLRSVNGPQFTTIDGGQSNRCAYLTNGASLSGFTLTNGFTEGFGGGVLCKSQTAVVSNCVVAGNSALAEDAMGGGVSPFGGGAYGGTLNNCTLIRNGARYGGGAYGCMLNNCTLSGNSAASGGGAYGCTLNNCTLIGNSALGGGGAYGCMLNNCTLSDNSAFVNFPITRPFEGYGGGALSSTLNNCTLTSNSVFGSFARGGGGTSQSTLNNCIAYFNTGTTGANYDPYTTPNYSCTTPQPTNGVGNITNAPLFVDLASGNLRLQSNSPCINGGLNAFAPAGPDLDGNPRIVGGTVDMGAYEFQSPASQISYAWLQRFNLPINPATDTADPDSDGVNNYREWLAGSDPTNPFSFPPLLTLIPYGANVILTWPTNAFGFTLQSTTNLGSPAVWSTNSPGPVVIGGQNVVINPLSGPQQFYRLSQ